MCHKLSLWILLNRDDFGLGLINHFLMQNFTHIMIPQGHSIGDTWPFKSLFIIIFYSLPFKILHFERNYMKFQSRVWSFINQVLWNFFMKYSTLSLRGSVGTKEIVKGQCTLIKFYLKDPQSINFQTRLFLLSNCFFIREDFL